MTDTPRSKDLDDIVAAYLQSLTNYGDGTAELEVRFGTARGMRPITRMDQDNVARRLLSAGFQMSDTKHMLRMRPEYMDQSGITRESNVRVEVAGLSDISTYCKTDKLRDVRPSFTQKTTVKDRQGKFEQADVHDFNFRVSLSKEKDLPSGGRFVGGIEDSWDDSKKAFRYIQRHTLTSPSSLPMVLVDLSVVRESRRRGRDTQREYKFSDSGVLDGPHRYEIEIEVDNSKVGPGTEYPDQAAISKGLRKAVLMVLAGIQGTSYPVSAGEQRKVLNGYMSLMDDKYESGRVYSKHFIGPSPYTLQVNNIAPVNEDSTIPNVRNNYTVTEKADGERKLLYVAGDGKVYFIDTNMNVQFTGSVCQNDGAFNSLLDGEHILHNKGGEFINLYAAFDIYFENKEDIRGAPFIPGNEDDDPREFRLPSLTRFVRGMNMRGVAAQNSVSPLTVKSKVFMATSKAQSIFQCCATILQRIDEGLYNYETDGLIFTPSNLGVGVDTPGAKPPNKKQSWGHAFKWKPPAQNTIDFLVTTVKGTDGQDKIGNMFQEGTDTSAVQQILQYKTAVLRVGFDERLHGFINPCKAVYEGDLPKAGDVDEDEGYHPVQFFPTNPVDDKAGICNIALSTGGGGDKVMFAENGDVIEDDTIAEFSYMPDKEEGWKWKALRVRYDKTADLRAGGKNFGNAYHVANSNWHSLHNPVTVAMLKTGDGIPDELADDDIYYNRVGDVSYTRGLRSFHNLFVKKKLIMAASKRGDTLIDLAVGKGGDWPKWIRARLNFVFGVDMSADNIENRLDGVCARTLKYRRKFKTMPDGLFVAGNSSANVRDGTALFTDKAKQITKAVFGQGAKDAKELGAGVYKQFGVGKSGFDVCSIQFALHYMFENQITLNGFLRNVSETTKVGGYFIGTSYDGSEVFRMLSSKDPNQSVSVFESGKRIWEVTKRYDRTDFPADSSSLGYAIDVFQETINKTFREYLVNFDYLDRLMENYGFTRLTRTEANELGLPASSGSFRELFGMLQNEVARRRDVEDEYGASLDMTSGERKVSFLNRYFIYRKTHNVNAEAVANGLMGQTLAEERDEREESEEAVRAAKSVVKQQKRAKKTGRRLVLVEK